MTPRRRPGPKLGRRAIALAVGIGASMVLAFTVWAANGPPQQSAADKQAKIQQIYAQETATASGYHAAKPKPSIPSTPPTSCPRPPAQTGINSAGDSGGFHEHFVSWATIAPSSGQPFEYLLYAGARAANPNQGLIVVVRLDQDPCSPSAAGTLIKFYDTPFQEGAVTITQISGDSVTFTTASGSTGHFDVVTGQFS